MGYANRPHALGPLPLQSGASLPGAELSWKTHGALAPARDNVIVYPTSYSAHHTDVENLIGPDGVLDPTRWFIVIPDMFANGLSSSPSNSDHYPSLVTTADNVRAQERLLWEVFLASTESLAPTASRWEHNRRAIGRLSFRNRSNAGHCLRQRSHVGSQPGLLAVPASDAGGSAGAYRRRSLLRYPDNVLAGVCAGVCWLGDEPGLVSRQPSSNEHRHRQSRRLPRSPLGARVHASESGGSLRPGRNLDGFRHQRQRTLRGRSRSRITGDPGAHAPHAR
jgi:hypothetical protein